MYDGSIHPKDWGEKKKKPQCNNLVCFILQASL